MRKEHLSVIAAIANILSFLLSAWVIVSGILTGNLVLIGLIPLALAVLLISIGIGLFFLAFLARKLDSAASAIIISQEDNLDHVSPKLAEMVQNTAYRLKHSHITVEYNEADGSLVTITKVQDINILSDGVTHISDREITVDPSYEGACVVNRKFYADKGDCEIKSTEGGKFHVRTTFDTALIRGKLFNRKFWYQLKNCYLKNEEDFVFTVGRPVESAKIEVILPKGVQFLDIGGYVEVGEFSMEVIDGKPTKDDLSSCITWSIPKPLFGHRYRLKWERTPIQQKKPKHSVRNEIQSRTPNSNDLFVRIKDGLSRKEQKKFLRLIKAAESESVLSE